MGDDLRDWLKKAEAIGSLRKIDGADWNLEIGTAATLNLMKKDCPALLFDNIKDYPKGYRVVTCTGSNSKLVSLILNLPVIDSDLELLKVWQDKLPEWYADMDKFEPQVVKTGPVLENIISGDDVDLFKFPAPKYHTLDGGRYIGTGHAIITKDPDTGEANLGTYRSQVLDKKSVGWMMSPTKDGDLHRLKYHEQGKPCPVAVSVGHHPLLFRLASVEVPSEYKLAGAMRGEPIQVIIDEVTGLPIPADAEIVLVGWCRPGVYREEGPFGEWTGYYKGTTQSLVIEVERIYHRNDPIIVGSSPGRTQASDGIYFRTLFRSALLYNELKQARIPDVRGVWLAPEAGGVPLIVVSIKQRYAGHARQTALLSCVLRTVAYQTRYVIVVDEDIDPTNIGEVLWALATRSDPVQDIDIIRRIPTGRLDPMIRNAEVDVLCNSRAIIDACKPYEWGDDFAIPITLEPDIVERVRGKWGDL